MEKSEIGKAFGIAVGVLIVLMALGWVLAYNGYAQFAFFAPRIQQVQTDTFHAGQAYTDGMATDLADLQIKYMSATDPAAKEAIRAIIKQRFASYDRSKLSPELQTFYNSL